MAKSKKKNNAEKMDDLIMDVMPGADAVADEEAEPFNVDLNFEDAPEEEKKDEEVKEEDDSPSEEEAPEEDTKPETEEEENVEPEATSEEGVDENSEADAQADIQPVEGSEQSPPDREPEPQEVEQKKAPMVPKSRLDEVLAKNKAMQKKLEEATTAEKEAMENAPKYDFDAKEVEYQDLVLNGETNKAVALRNEIRTAEKDQFMFEVQAKMGQTVQQSQEMTELQAKATEIENIFPILNENSADFDAELQTEVIDLRDAFVVQGYTAADALAKATNYTLAAKKPELLQGAPEKQADPALQVKKQTATVNKKLQAAESQPPDMKGEGANTKGEKKIDLSLLSSEEFDALPAETLRRMRGDFG